MAKGGSGDKPDNSVICQAIPVDVQGKQAVWIFTEFETGQSLENLREWLIPDNWPTWGRAMFKGMHPIGRPDPRPTRSDEKHSHAKYLEDVEIDGHRLQTELRCEIKSTGTWAAMSYDLDRSIGDVLQVDRGYLMAVDVCGKRHVKALKVVGFTDTPLNTFETEVCPDWSKWVQDAAKREAKILAGGKDPKPRSVGDSDPTDQSWGGNASAFTGGVAEQWISTVNDMVDFYAPFTVDVTERMWSGHYCQPDAANDTTRLFQRLARDWSRAWQTGNETMTKWAEATVRPTAGADPGRSGRTVEHTTLMVEAKSDNATVSVSDLTRIGSGTATIKSSAVKITPPVVAKAGCEYVTLETDTTNVPAGLYEGSLTAGVSGEHSPALFYVCHAQSLRTTPAPDPAPAED